MRAKHACLLTSTTIANPRTPSTLFARSPRIHQRTSSGPAFAAAGIGKKQHTRRKSSLSWDQVRLDPFSVKRHALIMHLERYESRSVALKNMENSMDGVCRCGGPHGQVAVTV